MTGERIVARAGIRAAPPRIAPEPIAWPPRLRRPRWAAGMLGAALGSLVGYPAVTWLLHALAQFTGGK